MPSYNFAPGALEKLRGVLGRKKQRSHIEENRKKKCKSGLKKQMPS